MKEKTFWYWFTALVLLFYFSMPRAHARPMGPIVTPSAGGFQIKYAKDGTPMAVANTAGGVATTATVPVALSPTAIASTVVTGVITGAEIAGPWGAAIGGLGAVAIFAIPAFIDAYGRAKLRVNPVTGALEQGDPAVCTVAPCFKYYISDHSTDSTTAEGACRLWRDNRALAIPGAAPWNYSRVDASICWLKVGSNQSESGYGFASFSVAPSPVAYIPASLAQAQALMAAQVPTAAQVQALNDLDFPPTPAPSAITGPATFPAGNTVKLFSDGTQQTEACLFYIEYFPSNIKAHPECTTTTVTPQKTETKQVTTTGPDGIPVTETVTTVTPAKTTTETTSKDKLDDSSVPAVDTPLGTVPKLYTRQYPDGLTGVWAVKKTALLSSPLVGLTSALMPSVAPGGTCPVMMVNFDIGSWHFGTHDVAPPCNIWALCKWFILIGAGLLCRRLIFGG